MKIVLGDSFNPYFNLAMEEYFLKEKQEEYFMLWRNDKSVIIGKNQNAYAEINDKFVTENNIKVVRRITGGGTVFHDLGNVNYTFITRNSNDSFNDYSKFCKPIIAFLNKIGINAYLSGRNDMLINDKKFSGNAQCMYKNSVMHHGTLLFSSEKSDITGALNVNPLKISSKGIASVRSRVTNISEYLKEEITVEEFIHQLVNYILEYYDDSEIYDLNEFDYSKINRLVHDKYSLRKWNYGFKQEFIISNEIKFEYGIVEVKLNVKNNHIEIIKLFGDFFSIKDVSEIELMLKGAEYNKDIIRSMIDNDLIDYYIKGSNIDDFIELLFNAS